MSDDDLIPKWVEELEAVNAESSGEGFILLTCDLSPPDQIKIIRLEAGKVDIEVCQGDSACQIQLSARAVSRLVIFLMDQRLKKID